MSQLPKIGFIGTGIMGLPMAGHLLKAGYAVSVHSRTKSKTEPLLAAGAAWCGDPAGVGDASDVLITIVTDTPDVEAVLFGSRGAAATLKPGTCVIDMSTISPQATRDFALRLAAKNVTLLDAPVTGGDVGARNATLTIMVGGDHPTFDRVQPILEVLGKRVAYVGQSGNGQMMKACNQILCAVNMIAVCEALSLARGSGLDPKLLIETLSTGAGGSWALQNLGTRIVNGDLNPAFMIKLIQKDLGIVQATAEKLHLPLPGTALSQQLFRAVESHPGGAELGTQAMIRAYEKLTH